MNPRKELLWSIWVVTERERRESLVVSLSAVTPGSHKQLHRPPHICELRIFLINHTRIRIMSQGKFPYTSEP